MNWNNLQLIYTVCFFDICRFFAFYYRFADMVQYNFKKITKVPTGKDFVDIVLSRTQRQTPTVVHKGYAINRIRQFYMRKVKFTQTNFHEKLSTIIEEFPRLDDIHPFYGDLLHVLYNKDHYKLALGQINTARNLISKIAKDYVKLLKYGDSLYRCKALKVAALGRMCTVTKRIGPSLAYLDQIRQHMARLPSIDPNTRTILICGYPNVGKSSFINKITRADVDVQPYAFTTKSLFVGHTDYKYLRYQVIDTPGILDRPFEDRNIIEMCSITALAHLRAAVLFFLDISGSCGYTISQQAALFHSIKSLFMNKPLIIVCNKTEPACIPQAVLEAKAKEAEKEKKRLERDLEEENGGAGVYSASLKKHYLLANDEWKEDNMPEILDGHNVYDFVDPDILQRLEELEKEEGLLQEQDDDEVDMDVEDLTPQQQKELAEIRRKKSILIREHRIKKSTAESRPIVPRKFNKDKKFTSERMGRQLSSLGLDPSKAIERVRSKSRGRKRERSTDHGGDDMNVDDDGSNKKMRLRSLSRPRSRSSSRPPTDVVIPGEGYKDSAQKIQAFKMGKKSVYKRNKDARKGEGDRVIPNLKPKHLYSGKRSNGKTTRR
ncbi:putative nucleolar GTP-binding protein [Helianthus debilis subsp. tardiflorus]